MLQKDDINKKTYNAISSIYVEEATLDHEDKSYIDSFLETISGNKILDLGCGPGILSKYLSDLGYDVTGVDFAEQMISIARGIAPKANFIVSDIASLELDDKLNDEIIQENNIAYGSKKRTGYAWKLGNVKKIDVDKEINGKLGLWNIDLEHLN